MFAVPISFLLLKTHFKNQHFLGTLILIKSDQTDSSHEFCVTILMPGILCMLEEWPGRLALTRKGFMFWGFVLLTESLGGGAWETGLSFGNSTQSHRADLADGGVCCLCCDQEAAESGRCCSSCWPRNHPSSAVICASKMGALPRASINVPVKSWVGARLEGSKAPVCHFWQRRLGDGVFGYLLEAHFVIMLVNDAISVASFYISVYTPRG